MQSINSFKNIQNLGKKGAGAPVDGNATGLETLEAGLFGPQAQAQNEFQAELAKNINLEDIPVKGQQPQNPELAQLLQQTKGGEQKAVETLPPTIRRSGLITHNNEPKSLFVNQPQAQEQVATEMPETMVKVLNKEPKSIFLKNRNVFNEPDLAQGLEGQKVQKGAQNFVHKSILSTNKSQVPQEATAQASESQNLINLRNMMGKTNRKAINGAQFKNNSNQTSLINLTNNVDTKNPLENESSLSGESANDFMAGQFSQRQTAPITEANKVFDMSSLSEVNTTDTEQVINKISDYITNSKIDSQNKVEMTMMDQSLGKIELMVEKSSNDSINVVLNTANPETNVLLNNHKNELMTNLAQQGFTVSDIKVDLSSARSNNSSDFSQNFNNEQNQQQQFGSKQNQQDQESQKRSNLWEILKDKEAA